MTTVALMEPVSQNSWTAKTPTPVMKDVSARTKARMKWCQTLAIVRIRSGAASRYPVELPGQINEYVEESVPLRSGPLWWGLPARDTVEDVVAQEHSFFAPGT